MTLEVGTILRVVAVLQWLDGDIAQNVFNTIIDTGGGPFDEEDIVDDMVEWMDDLYAPALNRISDNMDGGEVRVYQYDPLDDDWDEVGIGAWTFNPADTVDEIPRGVSVLINCKTVDPDVNGKKYFPGITEAGQTDGLLTAGLIASYVGTAAVWVQDFVGTTSGANFDPGVWSPTQTEFFPMTGTIIIPSIPAYQRRRKQGVGI